MSHNRHGVFHHHEHHHGHHQPPPVVIARPVITPIYQPAPVPVYTQPVVYGRPRPSYVACCTIL